MINASTSPDTSINNQLKDSQKTIRYKKSDAIKYLESLADEAAQAKYPNTPPKYLAPRKYCDKTVNQLTQSIIDFIRLTDGQAERINSTGHRIEIKTIFCDVVGFQRSIVNTHWMPGTADISATIVGRSVKVEVKIGRDRQSHVQKQYERSIIQSGGLYVIATSFEQFLDWYNLTFREDKI